VEQIEGKEYDSVPCLVNGRAQGIEVGDAVLVLNDYLAIEEGRLAAELGSSLDHPAIGPCPVSAMPEKALTLPASMTIKVR
jgi:hypothetical protein